jgi:hypothetical protein
MFLCHGGARSELDDCANAEDGFVFDSLAGGVGIQDAGAGIEDVLKIGL